MDPDLIGLVSIYEETAKNSVSRAKERPRGDTARGRPAAGRGRALTRVQSGQNLTLDLPVSSTGRKCISVVT